MYTLYWSADSGAFAIQAVLEELAAPYRREIVDTARGEQRAPDYLAINPMAQVPALRLPDGTVITETGAMLMHLCDVHPAHGLLPAPGTASRAVANRWLFWLATGLYESDLRYYY
ncbi:MAG: glutathione S-transferase family protein, partial [Geminicoccaceae bacterium]